MIIHPRLAKCRRKGWLFVTEQKRRATTEEMFELLWKPMNIEQEEAYIVDVLSIDAFRQGEYLALEGGEEPAL